ncbi:MAG TPA: rod shape-determining protein MreC [Candidatus Angelobacter sp.]|nr:rod shape-determining protein MreC [Candidatus Angelobacter sp.]
MENFFVRYKNPLVLMAVLFIQVVALATQVKRQENRLGSGGGTRLIRVWTVTAFTPVEKMLVSTGHFFRNGWHNYADLRDVRKQNKELQDQVNRLQMEQARLKQDADQARRLQVLLNFKEKFVDQTVAAQVIATSGTEQSRVITIDKGSNYHIKPDMAVITPDGIVGKIKEVFLLSSQVLLINDRDSGAGVILESSRLQGILKGGSQGELQITDVMADEKVDAGEQVVTSGGDRIFPKGLAVGTVISAVPDRDNDPFLNIRIKPAADLRRLEEVMVVTKVAETEPAVTSSTSLRAADILSQRLPSIPKPDANGTPTPAGAANQSKKPAGATPEQKLGQKREGEGATVAVKVLPTSAAPTKPTATIGTPAKPTAPSGNQAAGPSSAASSKPGETKKPASSRQGASTPGENKKPAGTSQGTPANSGTGGVATPTPTPKPKVTVPNKPKAPATAPSASPSTPEGNKPQQPETVPAAPAPTPTPEKSPR